MASTFLAIPLPRKGESFLLRTTHQNRDKAVLVDTGWRLGKGDLDNSLCVFLTGMMPDLRKIDRLILSHEDADHCEGAPQFIASWLKTGRSIEEVWLPALWAPAGAGPRRSKWVRSRIVKGAFEAAPKIAKAMHEISGERNKAHDRVPLPEDRDHEHFEEAIRRAASQSDLFSNFFLIREDERPVGHSEEAFQVEGPDASVFPDAFLRVFLGNAPIWNSHECLASSLAIDLRERDELPNAHPDEGLAMKLAHDALDTHERISQTVASCITFGIPIRWFDFEQFEQGRRNAGGGASGGDHGFLTPVNAVEVLPVPSVVSPKQIFYALTLSRANRQCLAFLRHEDEKEPAVLFTADSRLTTQGTPFAKPTTGLPSHRNLIVTAPHHASSHNDESYRIIDDWVGHQTQQILVRNGGHRVTAPAHGFIASPYRLCVRCIGSSLPDATVRVESTNGRWSMPNYPRPCSCH
ncbi:MBL fold metallo-hydrolase [Paracoccus sp. IB05]|uniref:MBL fold metallo-hydrolase n=1 Tax=Paracoccus sp. IB05 TaxID=2779367 RepID=UPI0018E81B89|nr:MBL fold metallo-hydrolase [Paracoccus sp. IB05]MBJ2152646.1 hypothetical protein [Paracoccus sp. IB05]